MSTAVAVVAWTSCSSRTDFKTYSAYSCASTDSNSKMGWFTFCLDLFHPSKALYSTVTWYRTHLSGSSCPPYQCLHALQDQDKFTSFAVRKHFHPSSLSWDWIIHPIKKHCYAVRCKFSSHFCSTLFEASHHKIFHHNWPSCWLRHPVVAPLNEFVGLPRKGEHNAKPFIIYNY